MTPDKDLRARLLPCPFCGGEARLYSSPKILPGSSCNVECQKCLAESGWVTTEAEAIAAWNRRVPADHERAVQDAVAKAVEAERLECARRANRVPLFGNSSAEQHASLEMACAIRDAILPDADFMEMCRDEAAIRSRGVAP